MDAYRLHIKLDFAVDRDIDLERLIPIFHRWIQDRILDELLIDVADYRHVPYGPGVMLIGHDADYSVEAADGRFSLVYARKRPAAGRFAERLHDALDRVFTAGRLLEGETTLEGLRIPGDRWTLAIHDRLLAPNDAQTERTVAPDLRRLLSQLYRGNGFELRREADPGECFALSVAVDEAPGVSILQERLAAVRSKAGASELHLSPELRVELEGWVAKGYPQETCGLLIGHSDERRTEVRRLVEARNLDRSRAGDRYRLDPDDFVAADNAARRDGLDVVGIWHSHPDCPARPSTTDLESAWEGYSYLIVAITEEGEHDFHSWRLDGDRFNEEQILPEAARPPAAALHLHQPLKEERTS